MPGRLCAHAQEHCFHASVSLGFVLFALIPAFISLASAETSQAGVPARRFLRLFLLSSAMASAVLLLLWASGLFHLAVDAKSLALLGLFCLVYVLKKREPQPCSG